MRARASTSSRSAESGRSAPTSSCRLDFVGNFGRNIAVLRNLNQPLDGNGPRPYPDFSHIQWRDPAGTSKYFGVDFAAEKRFRQGFSYRIAYTLSDAKDEAPEHLAASSGRPQDTNDIAAWEGPGDFDVRHRFVGNFVAQCPLVRMDATCETALAAQSSADSDASAGFTPPDRVARNTVTQGSLEGATWLPGSHG